jgi:hypothetical protein
MARLGQGTNALTDPICPALAVGDIGVASAAVYASIVPYVTTQGAPHVLVATGANSGARAAGCFDHIC